MGQHRNAFGALLSFTRDVNPFIANTVSMAVGATVILTALGLPPGFDR